MRYKPTQIGDTRVRRYFAFFPVTTAIVNTNNRYSSDVEKQTRWLEMVTVVQRYMAGNGFIVGSGWRNIEFDDTDEQDISNA